jgi:hypothetical protein
MIEIMDFCLIFKCQSTHDPIYLTLPSRLTIQYTGRQAFDLLDFASKPTPKRRTHEQDRITRRHR